MSALNKAVTKKASKRRAEQRRDRGAYTLAPPDTARSSGEGAAGPAQNGYHRGSRVDATLERERALVRLMRRGGAARLLDGVCRAGAAAWTADGLPLGSGKVVAAALRGALPAFACVEATADDDAARGRRLTSRALPLSGAHRARDREARGTAAPSCFSYA